MARKVSNQKAETKNSSSNIFMKHKWWTLTLGIVVLLFVLALLFGGWYSLWSKALYTVGADNRVLIPQICQRACVKQDMTAYCERTQLISYGEEVRATFLRSTQEPDRWKDVYTFTEKLNGTCNEIATGTLKRLNKEGIEQDFSVSFPYVEFPRCQQITC